jgi:hypothetical protein
MERLEVNIHEYFHQIISLGGKKGRDVWFFIVDIYRPNSDI